MNAGMFRFTVHCKETVRKTVKQAKETIKEIDCQLIVDDWIPRYKVSPIVKLGKSRELPIKTSIKLKSPTIRMHWSFKPDW